MTEDKLKERKKKKVPPEVQDILDALIRLQGYLHSKQQILSSPKRSEVLSWFARLSLEERSCVLQFREPAFTRLVVQMVKAQARSLKSTNPQVYVRVWIGR